MSCFRVKIRATKTRTSV